MEVIEETTTTLTEARTISAENELIPMKGAEGVGDAVAKMLEEIIKYRDTIKFGERLTRFYKLRRGEHWKYKNKDLSLVTGNLLGNHHQKTVNMITNQPPTFNAVQAGDLGDEGKSKLSLLESVADNWWNETEQQMIYVDSVHIGELYGTVGEEVKYDGKRNFPSGEVVAETLDPMYYSLYPPKCRNEEKAEGYLKWYPMTVREARRTWPESEDKIVGDLALIDKIGDNRDDNTPGTGVMNRVQTVISGVTKWLSGEDRLSKENDSDETFIIVAWVKDYSKYSDGEPVYPGNLRRIIACSGGSVVLEDEYNPSINTELPEDLQMSNYLYSRFPIIHTMPVTDPSSPFGLADFEQLEKLNIEYNKTISQFTLFKDKASRVKIKNPRDSGIPDHELDNISGVIHPKNRLVSDAIQYMNPPQMGADIPAGLQLYKDLFNEISGGFSDVLQGQRQGSSVVAAKAIALLLEEANRMAGGKVGAYSRMVRERGRMYIALAQMWYDTPRFVAFQKDGEETTGQVDRLSLQIPGRLNVVVGSTMPISNIQRREEVLALAQGGFVDQEYVLEKFNIDNYRDIISRMERGPLGKYLSKLKMLGIPDPVLQLFQQIGQMEEKDIQKGLEMGQLPQFMQIVQQLAGQEQPQPPDPEAMKFQLEGQKLQAKVQDDTERRQIDAAKAQSEIQVNQAQAQKYLADLELVKQKIETEVLDRQVKIKGVEFDTENIRIQKAQALASIKEGERNGRINAVKTVNDVRQRQDKGGYDERGGIRSNNIQPRADGGPVERSNPYIVGERGPEIMVPDTDGEIIPNDQIRPDGTKKGTGWLGKQKTRSGKDMTELSISVNLDGEDVLIPTLVPTLTKQEMEYLLTEPKDIPKQIVDKAVSHAIEKMNMGESPFYGGGDQ